MDRIECELRELKFAAADAADMSFSGYGAVFGNLDSKGDVIQRGAFAKTIADAKATGMMPAMLAQHGGEGLTAQDLMPIGIWTAMSEDDIGLKLDGKFAPTPRGTEAYELAKMKAINGLSIGFKATKYKNGQKSGDPRRTLEEIKVFEVSPVTFPANHLARIISVKSADEIETLADAEDALREIGMTKSQAVGFISRIKKMARSDSDPQGFRSESGLADLRAALKARAVHIPITRR